MEKEVWISVLVVVVLLAFGILITQKTNWFESSYNYTDSEDFGNGIPVDIPSDNVSNAECSSDSDCVPSSCCHPSSCVVKGSAPNCEGSICSQVCIPGTLDCGQGSCSCVSGKCSAIFNRA